ncbi:hypothetical protein [Leptolyngbya sp. 7M]|uniref:hypothetical protein n=1 Tax=Leptolyngbya sp. 7M TaxID=2812896 RepID=UPI001B8C7A08|nr:hypothetical protein [Leptolyngbya sp. 7M]QYO63761.1 hypothetical protein JVX88_28575 [Leptolyngbya sp. 7M]
MLLTHNPRLGQQHRSPQWAQDALNKRLQQEDGFNRYREICQGLEPQLGIVSPWTQAHQRLQNHRSWGQTERGSTMTVSGDLPVRRC